MLYTTHTKRGLGVQIWGTYDDLNTLYHVIAKFWGNPEFEHIGAFENRNVLISSFSYEVRKGKDGSRLSKTGSSFGDKGNQYLGFEMSWVHILFSIAALKENWNLIPPDKLDLSFFNLLEYWVESALEQFDPTTAEEIKPYLNGAIYAGNPLLYQFMRQINLDFFLLGGGRRAFKKLPVLLKTSSYFTPEYNALQSFLEKEAANLNIEPEHYDFDEDNKIYEIKW